MSTRTIIEINHDYLHDLISKPTQIAQFLRALSQTHVEAGAAAPNGIRLLGERHHSETLKLTVR